MDWDKLRIFHAVADAGSLTHAGDKLNLSQSAVSRQVRALEESLGATLFHRHARGLILTEQGELLMVSGFTDNLALHDDNLHYEDNWELSAQRALTVTRSLIENGMPAELVFAAAFGEQQPVATNDNSAGRARNRRVEMAPVPRTGSDG